MKAPRSTKLKVSEDLISRQVADYLDLALPIGAVFTHIASGGKRHPAVAAKLKAQGVRRGAPDYLIIAPTSEHELPWVVIFIELKAEGGSLSEPQETWRDAIVEADQSWSLCRSVEHVENVLLQMNVPLRARTNTIPQTKKPPARETPTAPME